MRVPLINNNNIKVQINNILCSMEAGISVLLPRSASSVVRSRENQSHLLMKVITELQRSSRFSAISLARCLWNLDAYIPHPPDVEKEQGHGSTFLARQRVSLFFSFSCCSQTLEGSISWQLLQFGSKTLISENILSEGVSSCIEFC